MLAEYISRDVAALLLFAMNCILAAWILFCYRKRIREGIMSMLPFRAKK